MPFVLRTFTFLQSRGRTDALSSPPTPGGLLLPQSSGFKVGAQSVTAVRAEGHSTPGQRRQRRSVPVTSGPFLCCHTPGASRRPQPFQDSSFTSCQRFAHPRPFDLNVSGLKFRVNDSTHWHLYLKIKLDEGRSQRSNHFTSILIEGLI